MINPSSSFSPRRFDMTALCIHIVAAIDVGQVPIFEIFWEDPVHCMFLKKLLFLDKSYSLSCEVKVA